MPRTRSTTGDRAAYKELADAYRNENKTDDAITAGEQYLKARPKDYDYMKTVAADYEGRAARQRDEASAIQESVTASTGGSDVRAWPQTSKLGRAVGTGRIDQELQTAANQKLTELYSGIQGSYARATQLYKQISAANPKDLLVLQLLRERGVPVARQPGRDRRLAARDQARSGHPGGAAGAGS